MFWCNNKNPYLQATEGRKLGMSAIISETNLMVLKLEEENTKTFEFPHKCPENSWASFIKEPKFITYPIRWNGQWLSRSGTTFSVSISFTLPKNAPKVGFQGISSPVLNNGAETNASELDGIGTTVWCKKDLKLDSLCEVLAASIEPTALKRK